MIKREKFDIAVLSILSLLGAGLGIVGVVKLSPVWGLGCVLVLAGAMLFALVRARMGSRPL